MINMKDQKDKKVPLPMKVRQSTFDELDQIAKERGIPRSDVAAYRIEHYPIPLTPELMLELQNKANAKYEELKDESIDAYVYETDEGIKLFFDHKDPNPDVIKGVYRQTMATALMPVFNLANALIILAASVAVMLFYGKFFTAYEKSWFLGIMVLATIFAVLFPEESANGVNGIWIMLLYLLDTFLNILCELLISKQSRYNFLVSVLVEITEIIISIVLMYRFATMTVTLLFWLPIDILSFINWTRHKDDKEEELTVVRRLKGYQEVLVILAIGVWTVVVGYFISGLDIRTDFLGNNRWASPTVCSSSSV